ncbi:hypothetical protein FQZ97_1050970 [compost metagenome]
MQHFAGLVEHAVRIPLGKTHLELHAQIVRRRLHELRIAGPEGFIGPAGIEKHHRSGAERLADAEAKAKQQRGAEFFHSNTREQSAAKYNRLSQGDRRGYGRPVHPAGRACAYWWLTQKTAVDTASRIRTKKAQASTLLSGFELSECSFMASPVVVVIGVLHFE